MSAPALDYGDEPLTDEENFVVNFLGHANNIVANAFGYMVDNRESLEEYFEYIEDMDPRDRQKYYGAADLNEAKIVLQG